MDNTRLATELRSAAADAVDCGLSILYARHVLHCPSHLAGAARECTFLGVTFYPGCCTVAPRPNHCIRLHLTPCCLLVVFIASQHTLITQLWHQCWLLHDSRRNPVLPPHSVLVTLAFTLT